MNTNKEQFCMEMKGKETPIQTLKEWNAAFEGWQLGKIRRNKSTLHAQFFLILSLVLIMYYGGRLIELIDAEGREAFRRGQDQSMGLY